jgi:predicted dithiol-disulfide oxidoreductase (DUF899 family)
MLRTYFTSARGVEAPGITWSFLDLAPLGPVSPGPIPPLP